MIRKQSQPSQIKTNNDPYYGSHLWKRLREYILGKHPICNICGKEESKVVDHIIPRQQDKTIEWKETNLQALCKACHNKKTKEDYSRPNNNINDGRESDG